MKKLALLLVSASLMTGAYADTDEELQAKRQAWAKEYFAKQGMPIPDGGITIKPEEQMATYAEKKEERLRFKNDIQTLGYIKADHPSTNQLLTLNITAKRDLMMHASDNNPESTHLKPSLKQLEMAYDAVQIPAQTGVFIGAAPYLTYLKGQGWVGNIQFFNNPEAGNCSFSENNVKLSHAGIIIAQEDVRTDINGKTTTVEVMGSPDAGFTYSVEWFDKEFFRKVECANKAYSANITESVIKIAATIDNA